MPDTVNSLAEAPSVASSPDDAVPVIDIADYLAGKPGALAATAAELQHAQQNVGFYVLTGHSVNQALIDGVFEQTARFPRPAA